MRLRVATYNIRKCVGLDWRRRPERILGVIASLDADVVALQEADKRFGTRLTTLSHAHLDSAGWHPVPIAMHDGGIGFHGNAILVRRTVEVARAKRVELPALEPRGAIAADLRLEGAPLRVVGVHLGLTRGMRVRQAHRVMTALADLPDAPTVVMGDMNTWHPSGGSLAVFGEALKLLPPEPTFHASHPVAALDRIAVSRDIVVHRTGVPRTGAAALASDHLPLWADIELDGAALP